MGGRRLQALQEHTSYTQASHKIHTRTYRGLTGVYRVFIVYTHPKHVPINSPQEPLPMPTRPESPSQQTPRMRKTRSAQSWALILVDEIQARVLASGGTSGLPLSLGELERVSRGQAIRMAQELGLAKKQYDELARNTGRGQGCLNWVLRSAEGEDGLWGFYAAEGKPRARKAGKMEAYVERFLGEGGKGVEASTDSNAATGANPALAHTDAQEDLIAGYFQKEEN